MGAGALALMSVALPAYAQVSLPDLVETQSLKADAFSTGILKTREGALPDTLWQNSDLETLSFLLDEAPARPALPAVGHALRRTLLSAGQIANDPASQAARQNLGGKKLLALVNAGFIDDALTIASLSDAGRNDPYTGKALALADMLASNENDACSRGANLSVERGDPFWVKLRAFCFSISGERDAADLTFSLLRDQGLLSFREESFLSAIVTGVSPTKPLFPQTPLELAIARRLEMPISAEVLKKAQGSVVRALSEDTQLDAQTRIFASRRALAMGLMSGSEYRALLSSVPLSLEIVSDPYNAILNNPGAPYTDAIVLQAVEAASAPEFLRDKASLIAKVLASGQGFDQLNALSHLYAADIANFEGALIPAEDAASFALARMVVGDGQGAGRWLLGMKGDGEITNLGDDLARDFVHLTSLLRLLDPATAAIVADSAGISVFETRTVKFENASQHTTQDPQLAAKITDTVFDAAMGDVPGQKKIGQAALASLALSDSERVGTNPVQTVILRRALDIAGLSDIGLQYEFQSAWQASLPAVSTTLQRSPKTRQEDKFIPSLKPNRRNR